MYVLKSSIGSKLFPFRGDPFSEGCFPAQQIPPKKGLFEKERICSQGEQKERTGSQGLFPLEAISFLLEYTSFQKVNKTS